MTRPVVGIIGNSFLMNDQYPAHAAGAKNSRAISEVSDCIPMLIPADPRYVSVEELVEVCDGFLFTGARPNVHPEEYGESVTEAYGTFDRARDNIVLPLIRSCVESGQPFFAICRGFQEVNVAMGGSLYPEIRELPGRMNHRMPPDGTLEEKFALRHCVRFPEAGVYHKLFGSTDVMTNTLHGQGIKEPGSRVVIEGHADDGTPEAIYIEDAPGFTLSVQWHPEWNAKDDPVSNRLFSAFGDATRAWVAGKRPALKSA